MNRTYASIIALSLAAFGAGQALAADASAPKTREQVKAELAEAVRTGNIIGNEQGQKLNEIYPGRYPAQAATAGKTREQVKAELAEAVRTGNIVGKDLMRQPGLHRPFKNPLNPLFPILGMLSCGALMAFLPHTTWLRFVVWLTIGLIVYFTYSIRHSKLAQ